MTLFAAFLLVTLLEHLTYAHVLSYPYATSPYTYATPSTSLGYSLATNYAVPGASSNSLATNAASGLANVQYATSNLGAINSGSIGHPNQQANVYYATNSPEGSYAGSGYANAGSGYANAGNSYANSGNQLTDSYYTTDYLHGADAATASAATGATNSGSNRQANVYYATNNIQGSTGNYANVGNRAAYSATGLQAAILGSDHATAASAASASSASAAGTDLTNRYAISKPRNLINASNFGRKASLVANSPKSAVAARIPVNLAHGLNMNTGTFATTDTGIAARVLGDKPCGIQFSTDGLQVDGSVGISGRMPFQSVIEVSGELPASGYGIAKCGCGGTA